MWYVWLHWVRLKNWSHNARCTEDIPLLVWIAPAHAQSGVGMWFGLLMFVSCLFAAEVSICMEKRNLPQTRCLITVTQRSKETTGRSVSNTSAPQHKDQQTGSIAFSAWRTTATTSFSEQCFASGSSLIFSVLLIHPLAVTFPLDTY